MARPRVVLDANALLLPFQFRINLDLELARLLGACDVFVPESVVRELERRRGREGKAALRLAAKYALHATTLAGDAAVIDAAKALRAHVVTSDRELLARLRDASIPRITLRSKSHLVLEG